MAVVSFRWTGKAISVNQWKDARAVKVKGRWKGFMYETTPYKNFKKSIAAMLPPSNLRGYFDLHIHAVLYHLFDTANVLKPVQDAIELSGLIVNDNQIRDVKLTRDDHERGGVDELTITLYRHTGDL